jgi:hypothetical protein
MKAFLKVPLEAMEQGDTDRKVLLEAMVHCSCKLSTLGNACKFGQLTCAVPTMSVTYEELFYEFPTIRLRNLHQEDLNNLEFVETNTETGEWTCCWTTSHPLNGCEAVAVPIAFEVCGRLGDVSMEPAGDDGEEEGWFAHWHLEALGQQEHHHAAWDRIQQTITQIARRAPVPLNTAAVLHHDDYSESMTLTFGWYPGADLPCVYVESLADENIVCVSCYQTNMLAYIVSHSSTTSLHTLALMVNHTQSMN